MSVWVCVSDGLVSYDIPQGDRRGVDTDFTDVTYDGLVDGHRLTGGLGQLTDGDFGSHNFRIVDARGTGIKVVLYAFFCVMHFYLYTNKLANIEKHLIKH